MDGRTMHKSYSHIALIWSSCLLYLFFLPVYGETPKEIVAGKRGYSFLLPMAFLDEESNGYNVIKELVRYKEKQRDWKNWLFPPEGFGAFYIELTSSLYAYNLVKENKPVVNLSIGGHAPPY